MTLTPFDLTLEILLDDGHDVHFKKEEGTISLTLNDDSVSIASGVTLEQIGQLAIGSAISQAFKRIDGGQ